LCRASKKAKLGAREAVRVAREAGRVAREAVRVAREARRVARQTKYGAREACRDNPRKFFTLSSTRITSTLTYENIRCLI